MDILKIATAGSVDDGKSTLIGRLLYETKSITKDKIEALESASKRKGLDFTDLSLLTDGLIAEREQGITIDVAHIYFNTPQRKYIIADTPGHFEYTRNMVTGASNASVSIILIDSRNGVSEQTKRHYYISSLLRMENVIVAINKMDLVDYSQERFEEIKADFENTVGKSGFEGQKITFIPLSSLYGENITTKSEKMSWFEGNALLQELEQLENRQQRIGDDDFPARLSVQYVIRPKTTEYHDFRGYAGRISSGEFQVGDQVIALPSRQISSIKSIEKFETKLDMASAGDSVVITLEDDIDISRGNMLAKVGQAPEGTKAIQAKICWMDSTPLSAGKTYILQHGINDQKAKILSIESVLDVEHLEESSERSDIKLNEIGLVNIKTAGELFADKYADNPLNGSFILIDPMTNNTAGLGFIQ
ncbi:sulfate adenylyltransferase subunit 1 [Jiulongibacter sediminis]|uniref:sulfate adenylyltransferase n=1 Tax=Jiulongibacter sediminis TaxID=1605367 RepID=A0A0P7C8D8_9BACT|nr:GTP-binding protein [Jiulongibacter sediminis]KPM49845.1 sulfate adenylyltransferase [Jiulongibacter sediminis]TBX26881.1 sulfate adenylyltransferase [Jiulongibacter sediminis]